MKLAAFLSLLLLIFAGVGAYMLHHRGLLMLETFELFVRHQPELEEEKPPIVEPIGMAAAIQKKQQKLKEETERMKEIAARLEMQRKELEAERALIEEQLKPFEAKFGAKLSPSGEMAKVVRMYEGMQPEQAASILNNLPDSTVAQILFNMRARQAAQIMESLSADKAAGVSELFVPEQVEATR